MAEAAATPCLTALLLGLAVSLAPIAAAVAQEKVGVDSAINPHAEGTPPRAQTRRIELGQDIIHEERIVTGNDGQTQILFLDQSALTVGPNSDMTIDSFVYDPNRNTGQLAMSATRGVMRFVGGNISKLENAVTMTTPSGALGIRGGVFLLQLLPNGQFLVVFLYGKSLTVTANGRTKVLTHPGWAIVVNGAGSAPSEPFIAPANVIVEILALLGGEPGATGGTSHPPTNLTLANSGISLVISGDVTTSTQQAVTNSPQPSQPPTVDVAALQTAFQVNTATMQPVLQAVLGVPSTAVTPVTPQSPLAPVQPPTIPFPTAGVGSYDGTATGQVFNNGVTSPATGTFNQTYNFGSGTGVANIGNFAGASYSYSVTGSGANFSGGLISGPPNRTGNLSGSFSGPGAIQSSGNFGVQSPTGTFNATGTFSGR
jgi:FecR protein